MRKTLLTLVVLLVATATIFSQEMLDPFGNPQSKITAQQLKKGPGTTTGNNPPPVLNVIPSPTQGSILDLAFDGEYLWVEGFNEFQLHQISTIDGAIVKSIPTNVVRPHGLTFDGTYLWLTDADNLMVQQIDPADGTVLQSFPTPADPSASYPAGLAWDGTNLWHNDTKGTQISSPDDSTFLINNSGLILEAYDAIGGYPSGLAFDGQHLYSSDNENLQIYKLDVSTFTVLETYDAPGGLFPNGLAFDGQYLWVSNNDSDSIYQIDIGFVPSSVNNFEKQEALTIYPNPTDDQLTIISDGWTPDEIYIVDLSGELIKTFRQNTNTIAIGDLPSGIYLIQIVSEGKIITEKFIKQ